MTPVHHQNHATWECKYHVSVAEVIGFIKGKSSIWIAQNVERKARNFTGHKFWARGYFVSTVGRDEETIRALHQEPRAARSRIGPACSHPIDPHPKSSRVL